MLPDNPTSKLSQDMRVSTHDDGATLLDIREGDVYGVNTVGARIIALLDENLSFDEIAEKISVEFEVSSERARADIDIFVQSLRSGKLVK